MNKSQFISNSKFRFAFIGSINTVIAFLLFTVLIWFSSPKVQVLYIIILSSGISYISGFYLYKNFVWNNSAASYSEFVRFVKSNLLFLGLNLMSLYYFVNRWNFSPIAVQLVTTGVLVFVSFLIHDRWTFGRPVQGSKIKDLSKVDNE